MSYFKIFLLSLSFVAQSLYAESSTDLAERFAVADDREKIVASLVPGTEDYFYYRCLLWQHQGKLKEVDELLPRWEALYEKSQLRERIQARQAFLLFGQDKDSGSKRIARQFNLDFTFHDKTAVIDGRQQLKLPTTLNPDLLTWASLVKRAEENGDLNGWSSDGLIRRLATLQDPIQRRFALSKMEHPFFDNAVKLIIADLQATGGKFGSLNLHKMMTLEQLDACRKVLPSLSESEDFVTAYIWGLKQIHEQQVHSQEFTQKLVWINALRKFTDTLAQSFEPLRTLVATQLLEAELYQGKVSKEQLSYLLSRPFAQKIKIRDSQDTKINDNVQKSVQDEQAKWGQITGLSVNNDITNLIRDALIAWFKTAANTNDFTGLADEDWLRDIFIEAKVLYGVGDMTQWLTRASDVDSSRTIQNRIELAFERHLKNKFSGNDVIELPMYLKNIPALQVRIYALDVVNIYRETGAEPTINLDLTGVVPTHTRKLNYEQASILRHHEKLALPECEGPGIWMIELIGGNQVARALIRKGSLAVRNIMRVTGEHLYVYNEMNELIKDAMLFQGDTVYKADEDGSIRLPYAVEEQRQKLIISAGKRTALVSSARAQEKWTLSADILVQREQLIAGGQAIALIRPHVFINDKVVPYTVAKETRVTVTTITHDNVKQVTTLFPKIDPTQNEWKIPFSVPEGLENVIITLDVTVRNIASNEDENLSQSESIQVNYDYWSDRIADVQLEKASDGWSLVCVGRAGEPVVGETLHIYLNHRYLVNGITAYLSTDENGRAQLGQLSHINQVKLFRAQEARWSNQAFDKKITPERYRTWAITPDIQLPESISIKTGQALQMPIILETLEENLDVAKSTWRLMRGTGLVYSEVINDVMQIKNDGGVLTVVIPKLSAGSYVLLTSRGRCYIHAYEGNEHERAVVGQSSIADVRSTNPLGLGVTSQANMLNIHVINGTPTTRVHVIGLRFHPLKQQWFQSTVHDYDIERRRSILSEYTNGRRLDPELGYILDRASVQKYPGIMLDRPGLLLNPWYSEPVFMAVGAGGGSSGMFGSRNGGGKRNALGKGGGARSGDNRSDNFPILDYLSGPSVVLDNLKPNAQGIVTINHAQLDDARQIIAIACNENETQTILSPFKYGPIKTRERRLMDALPPTEAKTAERKSQIVLPNNKILVRHGGLNRYRTCTTLQDLYRTLQVISQGSEGDKPTFEKLVTWNRLTDTEKNDWYSEHACHEVHLFLYHKDRDYFDRIIKPYIKNKIQKTFIDHFLLSDNLAPWLSPDRYITLNIFERILLMRSLKGPQAEEERNNLLSYMKEFDEDALVLNDLIATALNSHDVASVVKNKGRQARVNIGNIEVPLEEKVTAEVEMGASAGAFMAVGAGSGKANEIQAFRDHEGTKAYEEHNWYHITDSAYHSNLFPIHKFWKDYALWDGKGQFLSSACLLATNSINEIILALAISDLPFVAEAEQWDNQNDGTKSLTSSTPILLFTESIEPAEIKPGVLAIDQRVYRLDQLPENERNALPVNGPLQPGIAYVNRSVIFNPTAHQAQASILAQIPSGAIPIFASRYSVADEQIIPAYGHVKIDQAFYVTAPGTYSQFPTHVRVIKSVIAAQIPTSGTIVARDNQLSASGLPNDEAGLLQYLATAPSYKLQLSLLLWRCRDKVFWQNCVPVLEKRRAYDDTLWSLSSSHLDVPRMVTSSKLTQQVVRKCGNTFDSNWLTIDPLLEGGIHLREFKPLTLARAHRLSGEPPIKQPLISEHWYNLLSRMCLKSNLSDRDNLEITYAYLLQNRFANALKHFEKIKPASIEAQLQYNYLGAYLAIARGDLNSATTFATTGKDHPVTHWRLRFAEVLAQIDEVSGRVAQREAALQESQRQALQAAHAPTVQAQFTNATTLAIHATDIRTCQIRWHILDIEPLFSRSPFKTATADHVTNVQAALEQAIDVPDNGRLTVTVPEPLRQRPLAVEIVGGGQRQILNHFVDACDVRLSPHSGQLQVLDMKTGKPLPATYVKVYSQSDNGQVSFYKDGYTDLRGRFDYATLGTGAYVGVDQFALFIHHDQAGSAVREVSAP